MAGPYNYGPPALDFSALGSLPRIYNEAADQAEARALRQRRNEVLSQVTDPNDFQAIGSALLRAGDWQSALAAAQLAQTQSDRTFQRGIQERGMKLQEQGQDLDYLRRRTVATRDSVTSPADKRAMYEAEDEIPALQGTINTLNRAAELNDKIFTGFGASQRGDLGSRLSSVPQVQGMIKGTLIDPETGKLTAEYKSHMTAETIRNMGATMKGATTDFEFRKNLEIAGDLSQAPEVRKAALDRAKNLAVEQMAVKQKRIADIKGAKAGGVAQQPAAASQSVPPDFDAAPEGARWKSGGKTYIKRGGQLVVSE